MQPTKGVTVNSQEQPRYSRRNLAAYIEIVIGVIGIALTLLTAPDLLKVAGLASVESGVPPELRGAEGAIRLFSVMFVLIVMVFLVLIGTSMLLSNLLERLGACYPFGSALTAVASLIGLAVTITLGLLESSLWVPGFVGTLGLAVVSIVASIDDGKDEQKLGSTLTTTIIFLVLFLATWAIRMVFSSV